MSDVPEPLLDPKIAVGSQNMPVEPPVSSPPVQNEPEIRRAERPFTPGEIPREEPTGSLDLVKATDAAEKLIKGLFNAETAAERAAAIAQADEHQVDVEGFFERVHPRLKSLKLANAIPRTLPGQELVPLFEVRTNKGNASGALLRLVPQTDGGYLLDWPLFAETHEQRLEEFVKTRASQPSWFYVVIRRIHALALPANVRAEHLCLELKTTASASPNPSLGIAALETPLGRYLDREAEWGNLYVARLLLQHRKLDEGKDGTLVILDCEGAVTGAVFPSGAAKR